MIYAVQIIQCGQGSLGDLETPHFLLVFLVNNLIIKSADPGANTVTLTLYEIVNDASVVVDTFDITTANYTNYFSLYDMFSRHHLSGDDIQITLTCDADGNHVVTGQYSFSECYTG